MTSDEAGEVKKAVGLYQQLLLAHPADPKLLRHLGMAQCQLGNLEQGSELLARSLSAEPAQPEVHFALAVALRALGRLEESLAAYAAAIALRPDYADAHFNQGNVLRLVGRPEDALACYQRVIELRPDFGPAHQNRAIALHDLCRFDEALAAYDEAFKVLPEHADVALMHFNRGELLAHQMFRPQEALAAYDRALALDPGLSIALHARANVLQRLKRFDEASLCYDQLAKTDPPPDWLLGERLHLQMRLSRWHGLRQGLVELEAAVRRGDRATPAFPVLGLLDSPALQLRSARLYAQARYPVGCGAAPPRRPAAKARIRLAYVSADFGAHPLTRLIVEMLECHDRSRFEVFAIALTPRPEEPWRARVRAAVDHFIDVSARSNDEVIRLSAQWQIDIAVDLNGYTGSGRPELFARRLAPVQVSYLGYVGTMGCGFMDYLVADPTIVPDSQRQHYAEKIVWLPAYQCNRRWSPLPDSGLTRTQAGLPETGFVYCCFNDNYKITPDVFAGWMRILAQVPGGVLWLVASSATARQNLREEALRQGIDPQRVVFAPTVDFDSHMDRHRMADLFLDTYPYCAGSTASDALRAGLPVLTRMGDSFASRMGASIVRAAGLPELVASSPEHYEAMAVQIGTQAQGSHALRSKLAEQLPGCALFDPQRRARNLEVAYQAMFERSTRGLAPSHLLLKD